MNHAGRRTSPARALRAIPGDLRRSTMIPFLPARTMPTHATALFADRHTVHAAVEQLVQAGFPRDAISMGLSESTHEREFGGAASEQSGIRFTRNTVLGAIVS